MRSFQISKGGGVGKKADISIKSYQKYIIFITYVAWKKNSILLEQYLCVKRIWRQTAAGRNMLGLLLIFPAKVLHPRGRPTRPS